MSMMETCCSGANGVRIDIIIKYIHRKAHGFRAEQTRLRRKRGTTKYSHQLIRRMLRRQQRILLYAV